MPHYFVNAITGDDSAAGTIDAPWRTLSQVNGHTYAPGDEVRFARGAGQEWRGTLRPVSGVTYGAHGVGPLPYITTSQAANCPIMWEHVGGGIWQMGASFAVDKNPGFLWDAEDVFAHRVIDAADMLANMDWWIGDFDGTPFLQMKCGTNPAFLYPGLRVAMGETGVFLAKETVGVILQDLRISYCGKHGIDVQDGAQDVTIQRCEISYCGGTAYNTSKSIQGWVRQGEPINIQHSARRVRILDNDLHEAYDAVIGLQGHRDDYVHEDIRIQNNRLAGGHYGVAFWSSGGTPVTDTLLIESNRFEDIGWGFANGQRSGSYQDGSCAIKTFYIGDTFTRVRILDNDFINWREVALEIHKNAFEAQDVEINHNRYAGAPSAPAWLVRDSRPREEWASFTGSQLAEWTEATGSDTQSVFIESIG